jgi:hypothetical protein
MLMAVGVVNELEFATIESATAILGRLLDRRQRSGLPMLAPIGRTPAARSLSSAIIGRAKILVIAGRQLQKPSEVRCRQVPDILEVNMRQRMPERGCCNPRRLDAHICALENFYVARLTLSRTPCRPPKSKSTV